MNDVATELLKRTVCDLATGCWLWVHKPIKSGYCLTTARSRKRTPRDRVHRLSYEVFVGPIPDGLWVLHRCDRRNCLRPDHLFLGTAADNTADMVAKGRARGARGSKHASAKLTEDDVRLIRHLYATSKVTKKALGQRFGVTGAAIGRAINRVDWAHVV